MGIKIAFFLVFFLTIVTFGSASSMGPKLLITTQADPDAFINNSVNVINGAYCEAATDCIITGPDPLILQRYYSAQDYLTGKTPGGWRMFPQQSLIIGESHSEIDEEGKKRLYAFTGERSGAIFAYCFEKMAFSAMLFRIDLEKDGMGSSNTYAKEITGRNNPLNNLLKTSSYRTELTLGDGTTRTYQEVKSLPNDILGEELLPLITQKLSNPRYFQLVSEKLPSGNTLFFSYDKQGHLSLIELKNRTNQKLLSWLSFKYEFSKKDAKVSIATSDERKYVYSFEAHSISDKKYYVLKGVSGTDILSHTYDYLIKPDAALITRKNMPGKRFTQIDYDKKNRVVALKEPDSSITPTTLYRFVYKSGTTEVINAAKAKRTYIYGATQHLESISWHDDNNKVFRIDRKKWATEPNNYGNLVAKTTEDKDGNVIAETAFKYDSNANIVEESLSGALTGAKLQYTYSLDGSKKIVPEVHQKTYSYSFNDLNLPSSANGIFFSYEKNTNRVSKRSVKGSSHEVRYFYNEDAVCIRTICEEFPVSTSVKDSFKREHPITYITDIKPKEFLPGVGLPELVERRGCSPVTGKEEVIERIETAYSPKGLVLSKKFYGNSKAIYYTEEKSYDKFGRLISEKGKDDLAISYDYDSAGNQIQIIIPKLGKTIKKKYNYQNRVTNITETIGKETRSQTIKYDALGREIETVDQFGNKTAYVYDAANRLITVIHPKVLDQYEKTVSPTFHYEYDLLGNTTKIIDPEGYETIKTYNLRGSPTKIIHPDGSVELFAYDIAGSLYRYVDKDNFINTYRYNPFGQIAEHRLLADTSQMQIEYFHDSFHLFKKKQGNEFCADYQYDSAGRCITILHRESNPKDDGKFLKRKTLSYDSFGRKKEEKVWINSEPENSSQRSFTYDSTGNVIKTTIEDVARKKSITKCFEYDPYRNCTAEYFLENKKKIEINRYTYNPFGELTSSTDNNGNTHRIEIKINNGSTRKTLTNPLGAKTVITSDALGRITSITKEDPNGKILASQRMLYDQLGNKCLEEHTIRDQKGKEQGSIATKWVYGPGGRIEQVIQNYGSSDQREIKHIYDEKGVYISKEQVDGKITYTRDEHLRVQNILFSNKQSISNRYAYHFVRSRPNSIAHNQTTITYAENKSPDGNTLSEEIQDPYGSYTISCRRDGSNRLTEIILPDQSKICYLYSHLFPSAIMRISKDGTTSYQHKYTGYDSSGRLTKEELIKKSGPQTCKYNSSGKKYLSENKFYNETVDQYDVLNRPIRVQRRGVFPTRSVAYQYNYLDQLVSEIQESESKYEYDSLHTPVKVNESSFIYENPLKFSSNNRVAYTYDKNKRVTEISKEQSKLRLELNELEQIIKASENETEYLYSYDGLGRRIRKEVVENGKKTAIYRSFFIGDHELGTLDNKGAICELRIPGADSMGLNTKSIAIEINKKTYLPIHDGLGDIVALVDTFDQKVAESYIYTAFGEREIYNQQGNIIEKSTIGNPWGYREKRLEETGLIHFGKRYYDPTAIRWVTEDPLGSLDGMNTYAYVHANPVLFSDRLGLLSQSAREMPLEQYLHSRIGEGGCPCPSFRDCSSGGDANYLKNRSFTDMMLYYDTLIGPDAIAPLPNYRATNPNLLPGICNNYIFEESYPDYAPSQVFNLGKPEQPNVRIGFINGIYNTFESATESLNHISEIANGYNIHGVFNATHGAIGDAREYLYGLMYIATEPSRQLHTMWNDFFETADQKAEFLMICHSQGAVLVRNALLDYPKELRDRISVVAIAPGAYIYSKSCAQVTHYRAKPFRDVVPYIDLAGLKREWHTTTTVDSHEDADFFDHTFISPTYKRYLKESIDKYLDKAG